MKFKIAVVQFSITPFAPEQNLRKAERFIQEAAGQADLIVFPEDFVTGPLSSNADYADYDGKYVRHFQQLALSYGIDLVCGSIIEGDQHGLYNTTSYIEKNGKIRGRYRKVNLWHPERPYLTAGREIPVFSTRLGRVGLVICWDLMFPEVFRAMVAQGVEMVICPSYWCFEDAGVGLKHDAHAEITLVNALCVTRAFENGVILAYANAADGVDPAAEEEHLIGQSQVAVPFKGALTVLRHNQEAMFIQEVDTEILDEAEAAYQVRADLQARRLSTGQ